MEIQPKTKSLNLIFIAGILLLSGCTKTYNIKPVATPNNVYSEVSTTPLASFELMDGRSGEAKPLNTGTLAVELPDMGDEIDYLGVNLAKVLNAQGIKATYNKASNSDFKLKVLNYRIRNLRTSGFSPYHTFTTFSADLITAGTSKRITAYFKNSKIPVWSFDEIERPCYQIPLEVVVKEIAAKINVHVFKRSSSTATVQKLAKAITPGPADAASEQYLKVLELGYTNNPAAIEPLVRFTSHQETIMREAAISALGILGAKDQFPLLKSIYESKDNIDKSMALKSIGDLDLQEARDFIRQVKASDAYRSDETIREVADLYP